MAARKEAYRALLNMRSIDASANWRWRRRHGVGRARTPYKGADQVDKKEEDQHGNKDYREGDLHEVFADLVGGEMSYAAEHSDAIPADAGILAQTDVAKDADRIAVDRAIGADAAQDGHGVSVDCTIDVDGAENADGIMGLFAFGNVDAVKEGNTIVLGVRAGCSCDEKGKREDSKEDAAHVGVAPEGRTNPGQPGWSWWE